MTDNLETTLETLIDRHGLANVVEMLAIVCELKAEHLCSNWQDEQSAQWWHARANILDTLAAKPFMRDAS